MWVEFIAGRPVLTGDQVVLTTAVGSVTNGSGTHASELRGLFLDGNPIGELPASFFTTPKLEELTLCNINLKAVPEALADLPSIKELYLNGACGQRAVVIPGRLKDLGVVKDCYEGQI